MKRKFTAVPGKGIFAGSIAANKRRIMAAEEEYEYDGELFDKYQMNEINKGLESGVDVSVYADPKFNDWQMEEIRSGLESGVDVNVYADVRFTGGQMHWIREGLEEGLDVSMYADPKYDGEQMKAILGGLEQGIDPNIYANPEFSYSQMVRIRDGLAAGVDASIYADPRYSLDQMAQIRKGLEAGLDVSTYADPNIDAKEMRKIVTNLLRQHSNKQGEQNTSSNSKTKLHVEYYPYERYGGGDRLRKANITAPTELEALAKMCDKLGLYMDYDDVMENGSVEDVINSISESNGDGCDYITLLENRTTGEVLIESD